MNQKVKIKALKHPNHPHYEWEGELLEKTDDYVVVLCKPNRKLVHHTKKGVFTMQNTSIDFFFLKDWFTASVSIENDKVVSYYCNIAKPSIFENDEISFVDLDLDYIKRKEGNWKVVDRDEFIENSKKYAYSKELIEKAQVELEKLIKKVEKKEFPFVDSIVDIFKLKNNS